MDFLIAKYGVPGILLHSGFFVSENLAANTEQRSDRASVCFNLIDDAG